MRDEGPLPVVITPVGRIGPRAGGRTRAVLNRCNIISDLFHVTLAVLSADPKKSDEVSFLRSQGKISKGVNTYTFIDLVSSEGDREKLYSRGRRLESHTDYFPEPRKCISQTSLKNQDISDLEYSKYKVSSHIIECLHAGERLLMSHWKTTKEKRRLFEDGDRIVLDVGGEYRVWEDATLFAADLITEVIIGEGGGTIISDTIDLDGIFRHVNRADIAKIGQIHGKSVRRLEAQEVLNVKAWVTLTRSQKLFIERDRKALNIEVIPNPVPHVQWNSSVRRRKNVIVYLGHLEKHKRVDHIIRAVDIARSSGSDLYLEIYGSGSEREDLESLVSDLDLTDRVSFMGYTDDPALVLSSAAAMCFASKAEGMSLSIAESIICRCPVVSYNINYGPADLIVPGRSGYLVKNGDINEMSRRMIDVLSGAISEEDMDECASVLEERLSQPKFRAAMAQLIWTVNQR